MENWQDAASGLETHKNAVLLRVVIVIISVLYVVQQFLAKQGAEPGGFAILLGMAELLATVMGIVGVSRFAAKASSAGFAIVCLLGVALAEVYSIWITYRIMQFTSHDSYGSISELIKQAEMLPYIQMAAGIAGMVALLAVLNGISSVARAINDEPLGRRARGVMVAIVILGVSYGLILRWINTGHVADSALGVLAMLAIFGIVVLFAYIGVLSSAVTAMRSTGPAPLPVATASP